MKLLKSELNVTYSTFQDKNPKFGLTFGVWRMLKIIARKEVVLSQYFREISGALSVKIAGVICR